MAADPGDSASLAEALFNPTSVALIGVSDDPNRMIGGPLRFLRHHGFAGTVYPVNPRRSTVQGESSFPDLAALPGPVDHAFILLSTDDALDAVKSCAVAGVRVATLLAGGFADAGAEGISKQHALIDAARAAGLRLVGPNSLGVVNFHTGMALSASPAFHLEHLIPGGLTVISQSGSMMGTLTSRGHARGIGFAKAISVGNEADLTVGTIGEALADDPKSEAFLLFLETIRDASAMERFAARAASLGKPIIAFKLGRSEAGQDMAVSHTGALVGSDRAADAFLRHNGIIRVDHLETLLELPVMIRGRRPTRKGGAVGVVTTTGGGAALVVDRLGLLGVETRPPSEATLQRLAENKIAVQPGRVLDLTMAGTHYQAMRTALDTVLTAPEFEVALAVVGSSSEFRPELAVRPIADSAVAAKRPIVAFLAPNSEASMRLLLEAGVAAFRTPESCADAIAAYLSWRVPSPPPEEPPAAMLAAAQAQLAKAASHGSLNELQALGLFAALGLSCAQSVIMPPDGSPPAGLRYPVAAKILSRDVAHKTEAGGVALNLPDEAALLAAGGRLIANVRSHHPAARIDGVLIQPMESGLAEVLIGYQRDPHVGPTITLAMGGVLAEIYRDATVRMAPVSEEMAREMIDEVAGLAIIRGYRGLPRGDLPALTSAIVAMSRLAWLPEVAEAEANPLVIRAEGMGVVAVDGLAVVR